MSAQIAPTVLAAHPILRFQAELRDHLERSRPYDAGSASYLAIQAVEGRLSASIAEALRGDPLLGTAEVAQLLGKKEDGVTYLARTGQLPGARKVGNEWRIPRSAIQPAA